MLSRRGFARSVAGGIAIAALAPGVAGAVGRRRRIAACTRGRYFQWTQVREGAWVAMGDGGNVLVVRAAEAVVVDAKNAPLGRTLRREAEEVVAQRVGTLVSTHHHADHTGGNEAFTGDVRVVAHHRAPDRVLRQFERYVRAFRSGPATVGRAAPDDGGQALDDAKKAADRADDLRPADFLPTERLERDRAALGVEGLDATLHHFGPGHTDNDLVVHMAALNVVHMGDLVFHGMHPFFDPDGGYSARGWIACLRAAEALCDADTVVVPGHGEVADRGAIDAQRAYLEALWGEVGREIERGTERQAVVAMRWDFMDGLSREQLRERAIGAVYDEIVASRRDGGDPG